jgi:hypothetical protein
MLHSFAEMRWLQPYPDRLLDEIAPGTEQPDAVVVSKETIAGIPRRRVTPAAAATSRPDPARRPRVVLGETAALLETSVAATNSALQRARTTLREQGPQQRADWSVADPSEDELVLLERFIAAHGRSDGAAQDDLVRTTSTSPWHQTTVIPRKRHHGPAVRTRVRRAVHGRMAARPHQWQPAADRRELPQTARRHRVPHLSPLDERLFPKFGLPDTLDLRS